MIKKRNIFKVISGAVVLLLAIQLLLCSCNKPLKERWVYYDETYCADAWTYSGVNEVLKQNIVDYFKEKNISIYDIEIFVDRQPEQNTSCLNKSGRRVRCKIGKRDLDDIKSHGFYE